jgi:hypothetical protein
MTAAMLIVGALFLAGCLTLARARPGTRREAVGAVLLLASAMAIPVATLLGITWS